MPKPIRRFYSLRAATSSLQLRETLPGVALLIILSGLAVPSKAQDTVLAAPSASSPALPTKKRIAVVRFGDDSIHNWWGQGVTWDIGGGLSYLLEKELIKEGVFRVYTRKALDSVLAEKKINENDPKMRYTVGSEAGVGALITGTVTQFGFDDRNFTLGGGVISHVISGPLGGFLGGVQTKQARAVVAIDAQIVDVSTGEILAAATGKGTSQRGSLGFLGGWLGDSRVDVGGIDMGSSNYQNTILGEATRKCIEGLVKHLIKAEPHIPAGSRLLVGKVADVDGTTLELNIGSDQGIEIGDKLFVERVVKEIKDPDTGQVIDTKTESLGTVTIREARPKASIGTFTGTGSPSVGDRVRIIL